MREFSIPQGQQEVESGTYTITVGAGGSGATPATPGDSADGNNSSVFTGSALKLPQQAVAEEEHKVALTIEL